MSLWIRFAHRDTVGFGLLNGDVIETYRGNMFAAPQTTGNTVELAAVRVLMPCHPTKMIALWNNFRELGAKLGVSTPEDPLYFLKANSCFQDPETTITRPPSYSGRVAYEGELGIVIGAVCRNVSEAEAADAIFGYTCVNDLTASDILNKDPNFPQWTRSKSFDGFGPFGPVIATDIRPQDLWVRTILNGAERQRYPISDMVFPPEQLISLISRDLTLLPGDLICCGTSIGVGIMKEPSNTIEIEIEGIGRLLNTFVNT